MKKILPKKLSVDSRNWEKNSSTVEWHVLHLVYGELLAGITGGEFLHRVCTILEDTYRFQLVWVGIKSKNSNTVTPAAFRGPGAGYPSSIITPPIPITPEYKALREGNPVVIHDLTKSDLSPEFMEIADKFNFESCMVIPFPFGTSRGFMGIYSDKKNSFVSELNFYTNLLDNIAPIILGRKSGQTQNFKQIELTSQASLQEKELIIDRQKQKENILSSFIVDTSWSLPTKTIIQHTIKSVTEVMSLDLVLVFLKNGKTLDLHESFFPGGTLIFSPDLVHKTGECLCGIAAKAKQIVISSNITNDYRCTRKECKLAGIKSFAAIPLLSRGRVMGILGLASLSGYDFRKDKPFLESIGGQFAVSLTNALLFAELKQKADNLKKELKEKKIMLKEIHHRVKNNLNIVASLLNLQQREVENGKSAREAFEESRNRIHAMSQVHERLYQHDNFSEIEIEPYILSVTQSLFAAYCTNKNIILKHNIQHIFLTINTAIPFGLILTEIVTNAFKYAFSDNLPEKREGILEISLKLENDTVVLLVKDNGCGIPPSTDIKNTKSLGLTLIHLLTEQLEGTVKITANEGTEVVVTFPAG